MITDNNTNVLQVIYFDTLEFSIENFKITSELLLIDYRGKNMKKNIQNRQVVYSQEVAERSNQLQDSNNNCIEQLREIPDKYYYYGDNNAYVLTEDSEAENDVFVTCKELNMSGDGKKLFKDDFSALSKILPNGAIISIPRNRKLGRQSSKSEMSPSLASKNVSSSHKRERILTRQNGFNEELSSTDGFNQELSTTVTQHNRPKKLSRNHSNIESISRSNHNSKHKSTKSPNSEECSSNGNFLNNGDRGNSNINEIARRLSRSENALDKNVSNGISIDKRKKFIKQKSKDDLNVPKPSHEAKMSWTGQKSFSEMFINENEERSLVSEKASLRKLSKKVSKSESFRFSSQESTEKIMKRKTGVLGYMPSMRNEITKFLVNTNRKIKSKDNGCLLRSAVRNFDKKKMMELITNGTTDVNEASLKGITALHEAAIDGNISFIKILLEYGADISKCDNEGFSCLDYSVLAGHFECATYLVSQGARTDRVQDGILDTKNNSSNRLRSANL